MANANRPSGLSPVQYLNGSPWNGQARQYCIPSADTNAYAIDDPVTLGGSADSNGVPTVTLATAGTGNAILGSIVSAGGTVDGGPKADFANLDTIVIPATKTKAYYVLVADDPNILYEIQETSAATQLTAADVGLIANLNSTAHNGYISGWQLNATAATTAAHQVRLLGLRRTTSNNVYGAYAKWLVRINNHALANATVGI